ncbi:hypothetical protein TSUD_154150 [Trifolium subterraneum]|uniref:Uncharacterized protein n=1 Tax=Trifolium subterraneum TaxID=3900 RepID=A0A2Z6N9T4_TRISU|nr:hypothetical protein TSUD_154150 [Trifolium subterraneum]
MSAHKIKAKKGKDETRLPKQFKLLGLNKGGSDSPFFRLKREEVCKGCVNSNCAKNHKGNFTQTDSPRQETTLHSTSG